MNKNNVRFGGIVHEIDEDSARWLTACGMSFWLDVGRRSGPINRAETHRRGERTGDDVNCMRCLSLPPWGVP